MTTAKTDDLATDKINNWLKEMYDVQTELNSLQALWAEMSCGPRNANDVWALDHINNRLRSLRRERAALHKCIHEEPVRRTQKP
jgi:hypothetical protein